MLRGHVFRSSSRSGEQKCDCVEVAAIIHARYHGGWNKVNKNGMKRHDCQLSPSPDWAGRCITTAQTQAPNEDSGAKWQRPYPGFCTVGGSGGTSSIFIIPVCWLNQLQVQLPFIRPSRRLDFRHKGSTSAAAQPTREARFVLAIPR